ncbi:MAG TPA: hypothetical protein VD902_04705 [Symbiobacteriaceae bacterium]|nr:hypothetical protein [Symbiobacteriaceae bacterium]
MQRTRLIVLIAAVISALLWTTGPLIGGGSPAYVVKERFGRETTLSLLVERPGLFMDIMLPEGAAVREATVAGQPADMIVPWPGARRRLVTLWRGPVELVLGEGPGPFLVEGMPTPAGAAAPELLLPEGWQRAGDYVGRFEQVMGAPVAVYVPAGMDGAAEAGERVRKLYEAAAAVFQTKPVRVQPVVVPGPAPEDMAGAVVQLWLPDYAPDAAWWPEGAVKFYSMRLLDQTGLWKGSDKSKWQQAQRTSKGYALALWLDAILRLDKQTDLSLDDVARPALAVRTNKELLQIVNEVGGLSVSDKLDRMLRGREQLPISGS